MKKPILTIVYCLLFFCASAQDLIKFSQETKVGFKDAAGKVVVSPKYDAAADFKDGYAVVVLGDKQGLIDGTGKEIIALKYKYVHNNFNEGLTPVYSFSDQPSIIVSGIVVDFGRFGFVDKTGKEVISPRFSRIDRYGFREGRAAVEFTSDSLFDYIQWGYIDKNGTEISKRKYNTALNFREGMAGVEYKSKWGFINQNGEEVIPLKYDWTGFFFDGFARVQLNKKWGVLDKAGKTVIEPIYDGLDPFFREGLMKAELNAKKGFIDKTGKIVIPIEYDDF